MGDSDPDTSPTTTTTTGAETTPLADAKDITDILQNPSSEQEALLAVLDLDASHLRAYIAVVEHPHSKVNDIADVLDRHRRYVAKSLRELYDTGLVHREQHTFETGGYGYVYWPVSPDTVQSYFHCKLRGWLTDARIELGKVDRRIEADTALFCGSRMRGRK